MKCKVEEGGGVRKNVRKKEDRAKKEKHKGEKKSRETDVFHVSATKREDKE